MNITQKQKELIDDYGITLSDDIDDLLLAVDDKITEIGFDADYNLNADGQKLQKVYDQLYNQN